MTDKFLRLFDYYKEAVVAAKDGQIIYANGAARAILPDKHEAMSPEDIFPAEITRFDAEQISTVCRVNGITVSVVAAREEGYTIFSFTPQTEAEPDAVLLLSNVSGAIRNPISSLSMASGLLFPRVETLAEPKLESYMSMMYHNYYKVLRVTNNVGLLCRALSGDEVFKPINVDVVALCEDLVSSVKHFFGKPRLTISMESDFPSYILAAEPEKIEQLLLNLFSNSLKYIREGGKIKLSLCKKGSSIVITLVDNGVGVASDVLSTVWKRYKEPAKRDDPAAGLGMGLTIVRYIAELHGGAVLLESVAGAGTTVTVTLPDKRLDAGFKNTPAQYESSDMSRIYTELSDVLKYENYSSIYMD